MSTQSMIPDKCEVLVIGGGPGGSYTATALAREGVHVVLLEAEIFPRYHVGESMLASMRHFLRFIDLDSAFDQHGFKKKLGAAFKLNGHNREGYTDFIAAGGPQNYAWNVIRSEADDLMFRHAGNSGAMVYDGVKVSAIHFVPPTDADATLPSSIETPGRPTSALYTHKSTGTSGTIAFEYLVDASGRAGLLDSKYTKGRKYNKGLRNIANWGYWKGTSAYAEGTSRADSPYFEALTDESGWAWIIPLHNGTTSVGVVMDQDLATFKKLSCSNTKEFYSGALNLAPNISLLLAGGQLVTALHSASDYSYSSSSYAIPYARVVGDAGCFIDPFFSSGVHLAFSSALSAATTICAARRGDCDELTAAKWHTRKVADGYERFTLIVLSAYRQIRNQGKPILSDFHENNFDRAFALFQPIIQGTADISDKLTQAELSKTLDFCAFAFEPSSPEDRANVSRKISSASRCNDDRRHGNTTILFHANLTAEEERMAKRIQARKMLKIEDSSGIEDFKTDVINGLAPNLQRGRLGLVAHK
ncbi:Flavine halogenase aclH [Lachnellula suecica]|uniref:Flavine halogenase aclH n=1 Tax=Lachnellula suecica TaxID=602035 RepID=A0A8T9C307_9HELO|nr:Flavine halogenase aclH [Lachnellula suecica]